MVAKSGKKGRERQWLSCWLAAAQQQKSINADGALTIPNIKTDKAADQECTIGAGVTIFADFQGRTVIRQHCAWGPCAPAPVFDANGNPTGGEIGFERLENIRPNVDYFISLEAIDSESGRSVRSQEVKFTVALTAFTLTSQQATGAVVAGGSAPVPVTLNASGALFFPTVWLTANFGGVPRGITAKFANAVEGFPDLTTTAPTGDLEIKVDGSVAAGIYPIVISGYNGDVKETLTVQVVVGAGGKLYLPLVTR